MENKTTRKTPFRYYFPKMHERVQNKYEEMQQKIQRSKSVDSLNYANEDNKSKSKSLYSVHNVSDLELNSSDTSSVNNQISIPEEVNSQSDCLQETNNFPSDDFFPGFNEIYDDNISIFSFSNASIESLNDGCGSDIDLAVSPKSPPRVRLRDKIAAVRERNRKRKEEDKREKEEKKRHSVGNIEKLMLTNSNKEEIKYHRNSKRIRTATITIALIDAKNCTFGTEERNTLLFCKFRLGMEKHKSKLVNCTSEHVSWLELFNLNIYEDFNLELTLWSKERQEICIGRKLLDLSHILNEQTHEIKIKMESNRCKDLELFMLLTISGTYFLNTVIDMNDYLVTQNSMKCMKQKFAWYHFAEDYSDVGYLSVLVYGAKGLSANDTYCVLELGNHRRQTHTENRTNEPNWMKVFNFTVTDITCILDISVCDENKKHDIIGKISIPLLNITNGEKRWHALKDKTQRERAKGNSPRILIEMRINWHPIKAAIRVINPKETKYLEADAKFDRKLFVKNFTRCKVMVSWILDALKWTKTCFEWESRTQSFVALLIWLQGCYIFEAWMFPMLFLIPFIWFRPPEYRIKYEQNIYNSMMKNILYEDSPDEEISAIPEKEEKKTLRERFTTIQEITQMVQNAIGKAASIGESVKNLVNFTVPYLSLIAILIILAISFVVYLIPVKYIFMAWGINKFTRKIRRPNRVPNNEVLDLLSRVPDDETLLDCKELPLDEMSTSYK